MAAENARSGQVSELLDELNAHAAYDVVPPEHPYGTINALLEAEIGCSEQEARRQLVAQDTGVGAQGGRPKTAELAVSTRVERAQQNGIGRDSQRKLDYLAGHAPALLTQVQEGQMSIHRAYKEAKGMPELTPLDYLHRYWRQVDPDDRLRFLVEMLTPNDVVRCSLGFEEEDSHA